MANSVSESTSVIDEPMRREASIDRRTTFLAEGPNAARFAMNRCADAAETNVPRRLDVLGAMMEAQHPAPQFIDEAPEAAKPRPRPSRLAAFAGRSGKLCIAVGALVVFGAAPFRTMLTATSAEAIVNARVVTLRAPMDGTVESAPKEAFTGISRRGVSLARIVGESGDRFRFDDLTRELNVLHDEKIILGARLDRAKAALAVAEHREVSTLDLAARLSQSAAANRVKALNARGGALDHEMAAAKARIDAADAGISALSVRPNASDDDRLYLRLERSAAVESQEAVRRHREEAGLERVAASSRDFNVENARAAWTDRIEDLRLRVGDVESDLAANAARAIRTAAELELETGRRAARIATDVAAPIDGRIWELLTAPGERVVRGQELLRMVDCSDLVVTATVGESVYARLHVGSTAAFQSATTGHSLTATVTSLTGEAPAIANYAIPPSALVKQPYHVTLTVAGLAEENQCPLGQAGRVVFDDSPGSALAASLPMVVRR